MGLDVFAGPITGPVFGAGNVAASLVNDPAAGLGKVAVNSAVQVIEAALQPPTPEQREKEQQAQAKEQSKREEAERLQREAAERAQRARVEMADPNAIEMNRSDVAAAERDLDSAAKAAEVTPEAVDDLGVVGARFDLQSAVATAREMRGQDLKGLQPAVPLFDVDRIIPLKLFRSEQLLTLDRQPDGAVEMSEDLSGTGPTVRELPNGSLVADVAIFYKDGTVVCMSGLPVSAAQPQAERVAEEASVFTLADRRRDAAIPTTLAA